VLGYSAVQLDAAHAPRDAATRALGYLHANCGHCHNANALGGVGLQLAQSARDPEASARQVMESIDTDRAHEILRRLGSDNPYVRMPPLGVRVRDHQGLEPVARWIRNQFIDAKEKEK